MVNSRYAPVIAISGLAVVVILVLGWFLAIKPQLDDRAGLDAQADLSWLLGMQTKHRPPHIIDQAFQAIKVGVDWEGATVETATGLATTRGLVQPRPLVIDRPFAMWFTQKANLFPVATCYVDTDSWRMAA